MTDTVILIASRPQSKRLPRKVFKKIAGYSAIEHILSRLIGTNIPVVLCVPTGCSEYDYLIDLYNDELNLSIFHGNPESPLHRMADYVRDRKYIKWVVRITHDDVLIDKTTMLALLTACKSDLEVGYGITPTITEGAGVEVFRSENLLYAADHHHEPTEFVSYFVKNEPFKKELKLKPRQSIERNYRLTMDYEEDWIVLDIVLKEVGAKASLDEIVSYLDKNPHILNINKIPEISIYTCAYNAEKYVGQTVSSVVWSTQYYGEYEYIFLDDCSSDKTLIEAAKYATLDKQMRFILNEQNEGLSYSSNRALNSARGKYVMRIDADDWIVPGAIKKMLNEMEKTGAGIIYTAYYQTDEHGRGGKIIMPELFHHAGCALMDKRMINEIRFTNGLRHWDSLDLYMRIKSKGFKIGYIHEPLWYYRKSANSMSSKVSKERIETYNKIMAKNHE